MACKLWLPLRGNLENIGTDSGLTINAVNCNFDTAGRIGDCLILDGTGYINIPNFSIGNKWSYGCWIWVSTDQANAGWQSLMILNTNGGDSDLQLGMYVYAQQSRMQSSSNGSFNSSISYSVDGQWQHWFATYDGSKCKTYKNGVLVNTRNATQAYLERHNLVIGANYQNSNFGAKFVGKMQDVRIYDECLSDKEVKHISQALAIHYLLDDWCPTGYRKLEYLQSAHGEMLSLETNQAADIHYELKCSCSANNSNYLFGSAQVGSMGYNGMYRITGMEIGYGSMGGVNNDVKINEPFILRQSLNADGTIITSTLNGKSREHSFGNLNANDNKLLTFFGVPNSAPRPFTGVIKLYWLKIKNLSGIVRDLIPVQRIEDGINGMWDLQNNEFLCTQCNANVSTLFDAGPIIADNNSTTIYDCSGYQNNGRRNGNLSTSVVTPRYKHCMYFPAVASTTYIRTPFKAVNRDRLYTFNIWFNKDARSPTNWDTIFGGTSGYELEMRSSSSASSGYNQIYLYSWGSKAVGDEYTFNEWHMLTFAQDNSASYVYLDGQLIGTGNSINNPGTVPTANYYIAAWEGRQNYQGYLSDARIYCTCLSAEDVQELYETSMIVDNSGNILPRTLTI